MGWRLWNTPFLSILPVIALSMCTHTCTHTPSIFFPSLPCLYTPRQNPWIQEMQVEGEALGRCSSVSAIPGWTASQDPSSCVVPETRGWEAGVEGGSSHAVAHARHIWDTHLPRMEVAFRPVAAPLSRSPPAAPPTQRPGVCAQKHNQGSDFWGVLDCQGQRQPAFHPSSQPAAHTCGIHFVLALFHLTATFPSQCLMSCGIQPPGDLPDSDRTRGLLPCRWILLLSEPMGLPIYPKRGDISAENEEQGLLFTWILFCGWSEKGSLDLWYFYPS